MVVPLVMTHRLTQQWNQIRRRYQAHMILSRENEKRENKFKCGHERRNSVQVRLENKELGKRGELNDSVPLVLMHRLT